MDNSRQCGKRHGYFTGEFFAEHSKTVKMKLFIPNLSMYIENDA